MHATWLCLAVHYQCSLLIPIGTDHVLLLVCIALGDEAIRYLVMLVIALLGHALAPNSQRCRCIGSLTMGKFFCNKGLTMMRGFPDADRVYFRSV
jgi:hypothetical protein